MSRYAEELVNEFVRRVEQPVDGERATHACLIGRFFIEKGSLGDATYTQPKMKYTFDWSQKLVEKRNKMVRRMLGKNKTKRTSGGGGDDDEDDDEAPPSIRVVHLRRTDKCFGHGRRAYDPTRCGSIADMPFLDMCRRGVDDDTDDVPVYVSTEENDFKALDELSAAGCFLPRDLDPEGSLAGDEAIAMDYSLLETAVDAYTLGCGRGP